MSRIWLYLQSALISLGVYDIVVNAGSTEAFQWQAGRVAGFSGDAGSLGANSAQGVRCALVTWFILEFLYFVSIRIARELRQALSAAKATP
jgi:hypothetical protein